MIARLQHFLISQTRLLVPYSVFGTELPSNIVLTALHPPSSCLSGSLNIRHLSRHRSSNSRPHLQHNLQHIYNKNNFNPESRQSYHNNLLHFFSTLHSQQDSVSHRPSPSSPHLSPLNFEMGSARFLSDKAEVLKLILNKYEVFIFDMDGVLWRTDTLIEGACEAIAALLKGGKKVFFATNNSMHTRKQYVAKLEKLGFGTHPAENVLCASAAAGWVLRNRGYKGKVYMIGNDALKEELLAIDGVTVVETEGHDNKFIWPNEMAKEEIDSSIGAVVLGFDPNFNYYKLCYATALITHQPETLFIITNKDKNFPTSRWTLPGTGSFAVALETAVGREGEIAGKPGPSMITEIMKNVSCQKDQICMVGDNLLTDISFGLANGIGTVLVESGVHQREDLKKPDLSHLSPDFVIESIALFK